MISLRKSSERGFDDHGWGQSHFSFSFADYYDPAHMGFGTLRALSGAGRFAILTMCMDKADGKAAASVFAKLQAAKRTTQTQGA